MNLHNSQVFITSNANFLAITALSHTVAVFTHNCQMHSRNAAKLRLILWRFVEGSYSRKFMKSLTKVWEDETVLGQDRKKTSLKQIQKNHQKLKLYPTVSWGRILVSLHTSAVQKCTVSNLYLQPERNCHCWSDIDHHYPFRCFEKKQLKYTQICTQEHAYTVFPTQSSP